MKKELLAGLLLAVMIAASVLNILRIRKITDSLIDLAEQTSSAAETGDWDAAENTAADMQQKWKDSCGYLRLVLRHSEIDNTTEYLCELLVGVYEKDNAQVKSAAELIEINFKNMTDIERLSPGSVF